MNTSTLEHPALALDSISARGAQSTGGQWNVGRGQRVKLIRHGFRSRTVEAIVVSGSLVVGDDDDVPGTLELVVAFPDAMQRPITIATSSAKSIQLTCNGVFQQRGRPPSMWLTVRAEITLPDLDQLSGHRTIVAFADLNLNPVMQTVG